jgi:hypothetical protein
MMSVQAQSGQPLKYAPINSNSLRLAGVTVRAVDQVGENTAGEIEKTAEEVTAGAAEVADKLRELADVIRQHTEIASEHVEKFCTKATSVFECIVQLQGKLRVNALKREAEEAEDRSLSDAEFIAARRGEASDGEPAPSRRGRLRAAEGRGTGRLSQLTGT